jgi:hypothetical protein
MSRAQVVAACLAVAAAIALGAAPPAAAGFLDQCPCAPTDTSLFSTFVYPGPPARPATDPQLSPAGLEERVTDELEALLARRDPAVAQRALALFGDPAAAAKAPDVRLRAALALLVGTKGEPAAEEIVRGESVSGVMFFDLPLLEFGGTSVPVVAAAVTEWPSGRHLILVAEQLRHEHFALFAPLLVHEVLHADPLDARPEEVVNAVLGNTLVTAELLKYYPEVARGRTELSRWQLTFVLGILFNSRTPLEARGEQGMAPGSPVTFPNLYEIWYPSAEQATPGNPLLARLLRGYGIDAPDGVPFSKDLLARMDIDTMRRTFLDDTDLARIGRDVLGLELDTIADGRIVAVQVAGRRVLVTVQAGERLSVELSLQRQGRAAVAKEAAIGAGRTVLSLGTPRGASGRATVRVVLTDAYDNSTRSARRIRLPA